MTNQGRETTLFAKISRRVLVLLLLAASTSHVLAQSVNRDVDPVAAGKQPMASMRMAAAPTTARMSQPTPKKNDLERLAAGTVFRDCADCPEMAVIPPGSLTLASPNTEAGQLESDMPQHSLSISTALGMGRYEVTKAQFARFVHDSGYSVSGGCFAWNGSRYEQDASKNWRNPGFAQTDRDPVVCVNWNDAKAYTDWLTHKTGKRYRLPTEVEWEYAARAGTLGSRPWGEIASDACHYADVADASTKRDVPGTAASWTFHECDDHYAYTAPVGSYPANAFGLFDTLGNVWEWTEDCLNEKLADAPSGGRDSSSGGCDQRVLRGGGWVDSPDFVSYDFRFRIGPNDHDFYSGFRVARTD